MERDAAEARTQRNAALVEVMLLAASADGRISEAELETMIRRVIERPEFEGTRPEELNALVEASAAKLAAADALSDIMESLRQRLPDHRTRMLAFGLATAITFADRRASREELGLLKAFQAALGISEEEVAHIVDVVEQGGSLAEALGEPLERLYAEVMVLVLAADGKLDAAETRELVESFSGDPLFRDVSPERAQAFVSESVQALAEHGLASRVRTLAEGLTTHSHRVKAFRLASRIARAPGELRPPERRILSLLQATFGLADDEVERIRRGE